MDTIIRLSCYEPAGRVLELSSDDLTRHVIGFGATGSGKTTALINPILRQLLAWRVHDTDQRLGLLVLDPKGDDSAHKVRAFAKEVGRESDVVQLSAEGDAWFDPLGGFERLDQVEFYAKRLLAGTRDLGQDNVYWTESRYGLVQTALVLMLANGRPVEVSDAIAFMQAWWFSAESSVLEPKLEWVRRLLVEGGLGPRSRRRLELALSEVNHWASLDARTKELHRSTLYNALRPLVSAAAQDFFGRKAIELQPRSVLQGKVLVVSLDAISAPDLARLIFRIVRQDFYAAIQSRRPVRPGRDRLCGLISDELGLSVMPEDVEALSVIRAKGGFVVAAAQSLNGLDSVLGWRGREALMANFNTTFFFSARESALDEYAMITLGTKERKEDRRGNEEPGDLLLGPVPKNSELEPICPPGTLARLKQHQAFARLADGHCTKVPVWLQPCFFEMPSVAPAPIIDDLSVAVARLGGRKEPALSRDASVPAFLLHMHSRLHRLKITPAILAAAWQVCVPRTSKNRLLDSFERRIPGLDALPSCWLAGLLHWITKNPALAEGITRVEVKSGVLWPILDSPVAMWGDGAKTIPESLNLFIYPSLWRPISVRHQKMILAERPDLTDEFAPTPGMKFEW